MGKRLARPAAGPLAAPGPGFQLIEASAGTGKTYNITNQYILLLLDAGIRVDEILVVTYTEAATAELRDRVRSRLRSIHDALTERELGSIDDERLRVFLKGIAGDEPVRQKALRRLTTALAGFDRAAIFTIHGFCNKVLAEQAFAAGVQFQVEVVTDEIPILESVVADFVRLRLNDLPEKQFLAFVAHSPLIDGVGAGAWNVPGRLMLGGSLSTLAAILNNPFTEVLPAGSSKSPPMEDGDEAFAIGLTRELIGYAKAELPRRKQAAGVISYGDMLQGVWKALDAEGNGRLVAELREAYRAALIDEFQDTNPLQYEIFRKIFEGTRCPVVFVGDPKQAIFAFNGGDVFAYFDATRPIPANLRTTLEVNYRSSAQLVRAVSELFTYARKEDVFRDENRCSFPAVKAHSAEGKEPRSLPEQKNRGAMHWFLLPGSELRKKPDAATMAIDVTVSEIAELLRLTRRGGGGDDGLVPGDIAVLVRTHDAGAQVQDVLREAGIPSVVKARGDVFDSPEAAELLLLLRAVAEPRNETFLATALLSPFVGYTANQLVELQEDTGRYESIVEMFLDAQRLWTDRLGGFFRMAVDLVHRSGFAADGGSVVDLLGRSPGGERTLTNLFHLFELLHQENLLHPGSRHLVRWLERRIVDAGERDAEQPLRLESDEKRVQIVTIHSSKGLEYPVVFCPFVWEARGYTKSQIVFCHAPAKEGRKTRFLADLGSPQWERHVELARQERISENIRLLYVALTRARQRCYLVWGKVNLMHNAALPWLFYPDFDGSSNYVKNLEYDEIVGPVRDLAIHSSGGITWSEVEEGTKPVAVSLRQATSSADLRARRYTGKIPSPGWGITSYTSLTKNWSRSNHDRDSATEPPAAPQERDNSIFSFPSGARTGIVWHDLFESLDFQTGDAEVGVIAGGVPRKAGAPAEFAPAVEGMIRSALGRPITPDGGRLRDLTETVRELEFTFTISRFRTDEVRRVLQDPAFGLDPVFREAAGRLAYRDVSGFMMGAIDLLFRCNGRYYLADYKSNSLGIRAQDYAPDRLREVMGREHYYLQYLIYTVAAHRYLSRRVPGYSYENHFGGVAYLFLRGMTAGEGVFFDRPQRSLIDALEAVLSTGVRS